MNQFSTIARRVVVVLGLVAASSGAWAQSSATGTANATATVVRPITIAKGVDLAFGNVVPSAAAGTLTLTAASSTVATASPGVTQPLSHPGTVTAARFDVSGEGGLTYSITLPSVASTITSLTAPTDTMSVDGFVTDIGATGTLTGSVGNAGTQSFYVGGVLHVGANQNPGNYSGTFTVTVAYN